MRVAALLLLALAGCAEVARTTDVVTERTLGSTARSVIEPAVAAQVGTGPRAAAVTTCVVQGATPGELAVIAADATSIEGPAPDVADLIGRILQRSDVAACAARAA